MVGKAQVDEIAEQGRAQDAALDDPLLVGSGSNDSAAVRAAVVGRDPLLDVEGLDLLRSPTDLFFELGESPATAALAVLVRQLALATTARDPWRHVAIQRASTAALAPQDVFGRLRLGFRRALRRPILDSVEQ